MNRGQLQLAGLLLLVAAVIAQLWSAESSAPPEQFRNRRELVFWHFWGGKYRPVVESIVERFNQSQNEHYVRAIAMPGTNLDLKFFLAVTGGDPPDLLNQDDPIVADWAHRDAIVPLDQLATSQEYNDLNAWLVPSAKALGSYQGRLYALCNGLDIRALYYDKTELDRLCLDPPQSIDQLDALAEKVVPAAASKTPKRFGYLPDPRRLWAWGIVFGGRFYDPSSGRVTAEREEIVRALDWMASYSRRYGTELVSSFRKGDQALTGASSPLLQGRYVALMDGQWRVAEIADVQAAARSRGEPVPEYGVVPLPVPPGGRKNAGWVNGNFFVVPRGCKNPEGAWAFMKFWSGFGGNEAEAARACAAGGWIPASESVVREPEFQRFLDRRPLFRSFVELAKSTDQVPTPSVPVASYFQAEIVRAAEDVMYRGRQPREALREATENVQQRLDEVVAAAGEEQ